jgi:hypothetical protein
MTFDFSDDYAEVYVSFTSEYHESWWKRVKSAFKYVFNKDRYLSTSDYIKIDDKNINQFQAVVDELKDRIYNLKKIGIRIWKEETKDLSKEDEERLKEVMAEIEFWDEESIRTQIRSHKESILNKK